MRAEDVVDHLRRKPFVPLRIYLVDGTSHVIRRPDAAITLRFRPAFGVPAEPFDEIADGAVSCRFPDVVRIEVLDGSQTSE